MAAACGAAACAGGIAVGTCNAAMKGWSTVAACFLTLIFIHFVVLNALTMIGYNKLNVIEEIKLNKETYIYNKFDHWSGNIEKLKLS